TQIYTLSLHDALPIWSLVTEPEIANPIFKEIGVLNFINRFLQGNLEGTKNAYQGGLDLLSLFYQNQPQHAHLMLAVSHDTLLSRSEEHTSELQSRENL